MPLVLLLTGTVSVTPQSEATAADLLVDGLVELLVVEDGPHLAVAVAGPHTVLILHRTTFCKVTVECVYKETEENVSLRFSVLYTRPTHISHSTHDCTTGGLADPTSGPGFSDPLIGLSAAAT